MMGEKDQARREMAAAGLPVVPGSEGIVPDEDAARKAAKRNRVSGDHQGLGGRRRTRHARGDASGRADRRV